MTETAIESVLHEERLFHPPVELSKNAHIKSLEDYHRIYDQAKADPEKFWADLAEKELHWFEKWDKVLDWQPPFAKWFVGGKLNISYNCLDRHLTNGRADKPALIWEGEPGDSLTFTYRELHREVCLMANALKHLGVGKGDRVGIYMPMIPEAAICHVSLCANRGASYGGIWRIQRRSFAQSSGRCPSKIGDYC